MKKNVLAVSFDDHLVKLGYAQLKPTGWKLNSLILKEVSGRSDEQKIAIIRDEFKKLKIKACPIVLAIPRNVVTVRYLQLPTTNQEELKSMVDIQVVRQIPYNREEMVYDYTILETSGAGYTEVLLAIVHKDIVNGYIKILESAGIHPASIELESLAIAHAFEFINVLQKDNEKKIAKDDSVAIIDLGYANTNILVLKNKNLPYFTRSICVGTMHLWGKAEEKHWAGEWLNEINRSLDVHQRESNVKINNLVFIGNKDEKVLTLLREKGDVNVISLEVDSFVEGMKPEDLKVNGVYVSISGVLGAVKEGFQTSVNLIPDAVKISRLNKQRKQSLIFAGLLIAGIAFVLGLTINKKVQDRLKYMNLLDQKLAETNPMANELEIKKDRLVLIKDQLSVEGTSLDILKELYGIIPQKTSLTVFSYDDDRGVTIKGVSPAMSEVFGLIPKLENSNLFKSVTPRETTQRKIQGRELTEFHIDCSIEQNGGTQ